MFYNNLEYLSIRTLSGNPRESGYGVQNKDNNGVSVSIVNLQSSFYWYAEDTPNPATAWVFRTDEGSQGLTERVLEYYSCAVRTGDVNIHPMPVSEAARLFGMGSISLIGMKRGYR